MSKNIERMLRTFARQWNRTKTEEDCNRIDCKAFEYIRKRVESEDLHRYVNYYNYRKRWRT